MSSNTEKHTIINLKRLLSQCKKFTKKHLTSTEKLLFKTVKLINFFHKLNYVVFR